MYQVLSIIDILQIQMKVTPCMFITDHMNHCACGIAARASSDIYVIDKCPGTVPSYFGFKSCVEDILHVMKKGNDDHEYEVIKTTQSRIKTQPNIIMFSTYIDLDSNLSFYFYYWEANNQ